MLRKPLICESQNLKKSGQASSSGCDFMIMCGPESDQNEDQILNPERSLNSQSSHQISCENPQDPMI